MKRKKFTILLTVEVCLLLALISVVLWLHLGKQALLQGETTAATEITTVPATTQAPTTAATTQPATEAPTEASTEPPTEATTEPEPVPEVFTLTFAGDCTLGTLYQYYNASGCFPSMVGENYEYPFASVQDWFATDDFTMVNMEGPLTNEGTPAVKSYTMRGDPKLVNILPAGSVECVSIANNHTYDFGQIGYENTKKALDSVGIAYAGDAEICLFETERGLKIGVLCVEFYIDPDYMAQQIAELDAQGAEIIIVSFHWGTEGSYRHTYDQSYLAYAAIDAGANIVYGHHPHVLQEMEEYNGGMIYYSLGNFSFGGNDNPSDFDTALISQQVIRDIDGTVRLGQCTPVPCRISSIDRRNDFQPTPAEEGGEYYDRIMAKLTGTYTGPNLNVSVPEEEETTAATEVTTAATVETTAPSTETAAPTEATSSPAETEAVPTEPPSVPAETEASTESAGENTADPAPEA